jgi:hypothetical protein
LYPPPNDQVKENEIGRARSTHGRVYTEFCGEAIRTLGKPRRFRETGCVGMHWIQLVQDNPSSRTMALGTTQPLTEMSTRNLLGVKGGQPTRKADNLTAICEPIV